MAVPKIVLDTNVLYSGLYSSQGASYRILQLVLKKKIKIALSIPLLFEYEEVLIRNKRKLKLTHKEIETLLDTICLLGDPQEIFFLWRPVLPDPKDDHILELAIASSADSIVTHNTKDFSGSHKYKVKIKTLKKLLEEFK